jgi:hypothetical protein
MNGCRSVFVASTVKIEASTEWEELHIWEAITLQGQRMMIGDTKLKEREKERKMNLPAAWWNEGDEEKSLAG